MRPELRRKIIDRSNRKVEQTIREIKEAQAERGRRVPFVDLEQFRQEMEMRQRGTGTTNYPQMEQIVARKERERSVRRGARVRPASGRGEARAAASKADCC